jgi:hypothetical protein
VQIGCAVVAVVLDVFDVFATAYTFATLILVWIYAIGTLDLVNYDERAQHFLLTRSTSYAVLRASTELLVRRASFPRRVTRCVPFVVASLETGGMFVYRTNSYRFSVRSMEFAVYATLKSVVFLSLPLVEEWVA